MKIQHVVDNRTFEVHGCQDDSYTFSFVLCEVVRPHWKIFRTRLIHSGYLWLADYETVEQGILKKSTSF